MLDTGRAFSERAGGHSYGGLIDMSKILSFSSQVAYGHVGHSAGHFIWQRLGHDVIAMPTIVLSNRPDYSEVAGIAVEPARLGEMLKAVEAIDGLDGLDAVFLGYMPSAEHVRVIADAVGRLRRHNADLRVMCDPILGDNPGGLYIPQPAAEAIRDELVPLADIIKPNRFELSWLTGVEVDSNDAALEAAAGLAPMVLVTSGAEPMAKLANLLICRETAWVTEVERREEVPHGTGDVMSAMLLGFLLRGASGAEALALATAGSATVIEQSLEQRELRLVQTQDAWARPTPWPLEEVELFQ
jgi:pyridoxine kinase